MAFTEDFTESDDTLLNNMASWTTNTGSFKVYANQLQPNSSGNESGGHWDANPFNANQYAFVTVVAVDAGNLLGVAVRAHASAATYYGGYWDNASFYVFKNVAGSWTQLGSAFGSVSATDKVKLEVSSTTLEYFKDTGGGWSSQGTRSDSAISSGSAGVSGYNNTAALLDDWEGGDLGAAGLSIPIIMHDRRMRYNG